MSIVKGSIVKSKAGRDRDSFFIVLRVNGDYAVIADGKRRTLERPKNKKLKHLSPTNTVIEGSLRTNPQVKNILKNFNNGG